MACGAHIADRDRAADARSAHRAKRRVAASSCRRRTGRAKAAAADAVGPSIPKVTLPPMPSIPNVPMPFLAPPRKALAKPCRACLHAVLRMVVFLQMVVSCVFVQSFAS